jgi:hypothetical protein
MGGYNVACFQWYVLVSVFRTLMVYSYASPGEK